LSGITVEGNLIRCVEAPSLTHKAASARTSWYNGTIAIADNLRYNGDALQTRKPLGREVRRMLFLPHEEGQGLVEYALILVLIAVVVIAVLALVGPAVGNIFSEIMNSLQ
jgi:pilus assembly protein Flp/PilA